MPEERKSTYRGYTPAQKEATRKYMKEHLEEFKVRLPKGQKEYYKAAAAAAGLSLNQFAIDSMNEKISRDRQKEGESA